MPDNFRNVRKLGEETNKKVAKLPRNKINKLGEQTYKKVAKLSRNKINYAEDFIDVRKVEKHDDTIQYKRLLNSKCSEHNLMKSANHLLISIRKKNFYQTIP